MATTNLIIEMPRVKLGNQGLEVSRLGYGCMGLTGIYNNPLSVEEAIKVLKEAFNKGITFFDTADVYGLDHANEILIGKLLKELPRDKIQLATKFGIFKFEPTKVTVKGTSEYARACCEGSLKRLGVDYIDLYYIHRIDTTVPIEDTMEELKKMVEEGKIKYIGLSEANADTIRRAHAVHPITALQMEYSLWTREIEDELIPLCRELGIGIVPYCPLGRGFFGGKAIKESIPENSLLGWHARFTGENLTKNKILYDRVEAMAATHTPAVSRLGYGCMGLTGIYNNPLSVEEAIKVLKEAFNKGITFFDTADVYGLDHANEILIGKLLKELPRDKIQLATKFGIFKFEPTKVTVKGTSEYARACCEGSLKRLGVDYIDLYYIHRIDTTVPIEDTMEELKKMVEEGKIKYIGLSEANADTIRRAHAVHPITALQMEYSLWTREIEDELIPLCRELGIGIVPYCPLGRGFFGGKAIKESIPENSLLGWHARFTGENLTKNKILYDRVEAMAEKHGCSTAQLALAWVLHQGNDVVPIPGTTKIKNLEENIGSVNVKLTKQEVEAISNAVPVDEVVGSKINEALLRVSWKFANTPPKNNNRSS